MSRGIAAPSYIPCHRISPSAAAYLRRISPVPPHISAAYLRRRRISPPYISCTPHFYAAPFLSATPLRRTVPIRHTSPVKCRFSQGITPAPACYYGAGVLLRYGYILIPQYPTAYFHTAGHTSILVGIFRYPTAYLDGLWHTPRHTKIPHRIFRYSTA